MLLSGAEALQTWVLLSGAEALQAWCAGILPGSFSHEPGISRACAGLLLEAGGTPDGSGTLGEG